MKFGHSYIKGQTGKVIIHRDTPLLVLGPGVFLDLSQVYFDSFTVEQWGKIEMSSSCMSTNAIVHNGDERVEESYYYREVWKWQEKQHIESGCTQKKKKASKTS